MNLAAREPYHKHGLGDNKADVDQSPANMFDREPDHKVRPSIIGPREHPEALKTYGFTRVHVDETRNTYHNAIAYKDMYRRSLTQFVFGKNNHVIVLDATVVVFHMLSEDTTKGAESSAAHHKEVVRELLKQATNS